MLFNLFYFFATNDFYLTDILFVGVDRLLIIKLPVYSGV